MNRKEYEELQKKIDKEYEEAHYLIYLFFILVILTPAAGLGIGYLIKTFL